jgi:hypothetical protein
VRKVFLVCAVAMSSATAGIAGERAADSAAKDNMSLEAAYDEACANAFVLILNSYSDHSPLSDRAVANIQMCNGHPNQMDCEISSKMLLREYNKSPFTCGTNTATSVPQVFPADAKRSLK